MEDIRQTPCEHRACRLGPSMHLGNELNCPRGKMGVKLMFTDALVSFFESGWVQDLERNKALTCL